MRWRRRQRGPQSEIHAEARLAIAQCLSGGESDVAWNAVWDLVQTTDRAAKEDVLAMLRDYVDHAVASSRASTEATRYFGRSEAADGGDLLTVDRQWHKIEHACAFEEAIQDSLTATAPRTLPSAEVRAMQRADELARYEEKLAGLGIRPGDGIPMWMLYMTRRNKRSIG